MAKALKVVAAVAGIVATVAPFFGPVGVIVGAVAGAISVVASVGAQLLQKPPSSSMKGSINEVVIGANMPVPWGMGRTYTGGMKVYDDSSGGSTNDFRSQVFVGSHGGPIESLDQFLGDYSPIAFPTSGGLLAGEATDYYAGFMWITSRKGGRPDSALTPPGGVTMRNWGANHKLSGMAAWVVTMKFDKKGKRFSGGVPAFGVIGKWAKVYDPRLDGTYPGGSGPQRWNDESTWAWSENAALHALTYARGIFMGPSNAKVVGVGIPQASIDIPAFVELANVCQANNWKAGGFVYEGPGISKWDNLKRILDSAAAKPVWVGGVLTLSISAPKVALDVVTMDDIADGEIVIPAMTSWKDKFNTIVPRYRSETHRWEYVQAEAVTQSTYVTEDGEVKSDERQYDFIQNKDLAAQRAAYDLVNEREFGPIQLPLKPRLRLYRPGEALQLNLPELGLNNQLAVIVSRTLNPQTAGVILELMSETTAKHAYALGRTGVAPPTPVIVPPDQVDTAISEASLTEADITQLIAQSSCTNLVFSVAEPVAPSTNYTITISNHTRVYADKTVAVTGASFPMGGIDADDLLLVYYDDPERDGGTVSYQIWPLNEGIGEVDPAFPSANNPYRHYVLTIKVPTTGTASGGTAAGSGGGGSRPGGWSTVYQ